MRINLEKFSLRADLDICISSSKILTICKDIFSQQKQQYENGNRTDRPGNIGANQQTPGNKFFLCFLDSRVIGITETRR